jgi:lipoate synthase
VTEECVKLHPETKDELTLKGSEILVKAVTELSLTEPNIGVNCTSSDHRNADQNWINQQKRDSYNIYIENIEKLLSLHQAQPSH